MNQMLAATAVAALLATTPAWAQSNTATSAPTTTAPRGGSHPSTAGRTALSQQDQHFVEAAAAGGKAEIKAGQLAEQKATNPAVQEFGRWMATDHRTLDNELMAIARREHAAAEAKTSQPTTAEQDQLQHLLSLGGSQFDHQYMQGQLRDHEATIALFEDEAKSGENHRLKGFADHALPILRDHLKEAQILTSGAQVSQNATGRTSSGSSTKPGGASTDKALGEPAPGRVGPPHAPLPTGSPNPGR